MQPPILVALALPPQVFGSRPEDGDTLETNRVVFHGTGLHNAGAPQVFDLTVGAPVALAWSREVDQPIPSQSASVPGPGPADTISGALTVWIRHFAPGHRYRLSLCDRTIEIVAGAQSNIEPPIDGARWLEPVRLVRKPGEIAYRRAPSGWLHRVMLLVGLRSEEKLEEQWVWE